MARNDQRGANNNPEGHNQYSNGFFDGARDRPVATAAAAAAAVGAGVFLWSRRNQISDQLSNLSDQFSQFTGGQQFGTARDTRDSEDFEFADAAATGLSASTSGKAASAAIRPASRASLPGTDASTTGASGGGGSF